MLTKHGVKGGKGQVAEEVNVNKLSFGYLQIHILQLLLTDCMF